MPELFLQVELLEDLIKSQKEPECNFHDKDSSQEKDNVAPPVSVDDIDMLLAIDDDVKNISTLISNNDNNNRSATRQGRSQQQHQVVGAANGKSDFPTPLLTGNVSAAAISIEKSSPIIDNVFQHRLQDSNSMNQQKSSYSDDRLVCIVRFSFLLFLLWTDGS